MSPLVPYRKLIAKLSLDAHIAPRRYRVKALWVAARCPAYLLGWFVLSAALIAAPALPMALTWWMIGLSLAGIGLLALLFRSLNVELSRPRGVSVSPEEAPEFWRAVRRLSQKLGSPVPSQIIIDDRMGVRLIEYPRWGCLGDSRFVLQVGLPWLQAMSPKQARAGLAQACARYSWSQGWINNWFSRSRDFWPRFIDALPQGRVGFRGTLFAYLRREVPYAQAYTLCLASDRVFAFDALAAQCVGAERTAQSIVRYTVLSRWLDEYFWVELMRHADDEITPKKTPHQSMAAAFRVASRGVALKTMFEEEMARKHFPEHVLPCLRDRTDALDQAVGLVAMPEQTAAEFLLGPHFERIVGELDHDWRQGIDQVWRERHEAVQAARRWLSDFGEPNVETLSLAALSAYAAALLTVGDRMRAIPLLRRAAEHPEGTADTAWMTAQALIDQGNPEALHYLDLVMARDSLRIAELAELALSLCERHGKRERLSEYRKILDEWAVV